VPVLSVIGRLLRELSRAHSEADVESSLVSLVVHDDGSGAVISRDRTRPEAAPLFGRTHMPSAIVRIEPGVYEQTPTVQARVRLLAAAASIGSRIEVHAPIASDGTYRGRLFIDLPRRAVRAAGATRAEAGDRYDDKFVHAFFADEMLIVEAARAGLAFVGRRRSWIVLERGRVNDTETAAPFANEVGRAVAIVVQAERTRTREAPERAVALMRERGARQPARGPIGRSRLRLAIGWVDAFFPRGPNCFRRTLIEIALDAGAAQETLVFGLDVDKTGHVWFKDAEDRAFDVTFDVPPPSPHGRATSDGT
jgi:hypothetical protein